MNERVEQLLLEIVDACEWIETIVAGHGFDDFTADYRFRLQIERLLGNAGEALRQARARDASIADGITDFQLIIDMRNRLIHNYSGLDDYIVWEAATMGAPILKQEVDALLKGRG
jgi:uncharacterized protein with HEPN domain